MKEGDEDAVSAVGCGALSPATSVHVLVLRRISLLTARLAWLTVPRFSPFEPGGG